jgi:hypothetical protein
MKFEVYVLQDDPMSAGGPIVIGAEDKIFKIGAFNRYLEDNKDIIKLVSISASMIVVHFNG